MDRQTATHRIILVHVFPDSWSGLPNKDVHHKPEGQEVRKLMLVNPDFLREQEAEEANSKHVRTYNSRPETRPLMQSDNVVLHSHHNAVTT